MKDYFLQLPDWIQNRCIGVGASLATFSVMYPIDTMSTRLRFYNQSFYTGDVRQFFYRYRDAISPNQNYQGFKPLMRSFFNVGLAWGISYLTLAGTLALPLQKDLEKIALKKTDTENINHTILLQAAAGWLAAFIQLVILHPIDSMKVNAQKNSHLLSDGSMKYFLTHQAQLRRGTGVVGLGSVTNFVAWTAKLYMNEYLKNRELNDYQKKMMCALSFSMTHIILAFPINTIKTWAQGDTEFTASQKTFLEKTKRTLEISRNNIKISGPTILYRGFFSRGMMHIVSFAMQMTLFDSCQKKSP